MAEETPGADRFLEAAIAEAKAGRAGGGIPIGSVLIIDGEIVGRGHNQRVQPIHSFGRLVAVQQSRASGDAEWQHKQQRAETR